MIDERPLLPLWQSLIPVAMKANQASYTLVWLIEQFDTRLLPWAYTPLGRLQARKAA
jgi:hypothetical protein